jgi:hypothetical protein
MDKNNGSVIAIILGSLMLLAAAWIPSSGGTVVQDDKLKGTLLICIHEKQTPTIDEVLAVREAKSFVTANNFSGWLVIDKDDPNWKPVVDKAASRQIDPPLLAAGVVENGKLTTLIKVVKWQNGLEDILK